MKDLRTVKGTVANYFNKHLDEIYAPLNSNDIEGCSNVVLELLKSPEITDKEAKQKATELLSKLKGQAFITVLSTYIMGIKAN